jgi:hypothetical protein
MATTISHLVLWQFFLFKNVGHKFVCLWEHGPAACLEQFSQNDNETWRYKLPATLNSNLNFINDLLWS